MAAEIEARPLRLADGVPGGIILQSHVITVTNSGEFMTYVCDGHGMCCSLVLDFPGGPRQVFRCPYTAGVHGSVYSYALMETLFSKLFSLGIVETPRDRLVLQLLSFVLEFAVNRHSCPLDGPRRVPVAHITVEAIDDVLLAGSLRETGLIRATSESVEALSRVPVNELEAHAYCVVCLEEYDHDHDHDQIARMPCGHVFHRDCVAKWLDKSHVCPLCRYEMPGEEIMQISTHAN